jgi:hypothetical protein
MKKIFVFLAFTSTGSAIAQVKPDTTTRPASVSNVNSVPTAYSSSIKVNYIGTWEPSKPFTNDSDVISTSRTVGEVKQTTQYFDGLGRPLQSVVKAISPLGKDIVSPVVYDEFGREVFKYLPYVQIDSNTNTGKFKLDPFHNQASFFSNVTYNPGLAGEQVYYSKTVFENSPLGRADTSFAPGNSWGGSHVGVSVKSLVNSVADSVRIWNISMAVDTIPVTSAKYAAGQLYKTVTIDEHGKQVVEYKDKEGQIILKKVQLDASPSTHHAGWLCTYYVYDDLNQLRFVISPKAVEAISSNWTITTTIADELCFRYEYDERKRMIIKKVPGANEVNMVYDARDRLVMTQDANLNNAGKWLVTQYDSLNRPSRAYTWNNTSSRSAHAENVASSSTYPSLSGTYTLLTETYYDDYSWVSGSGSGLSSGLITTYNSNTSYFYTASNTTSPYPQSIAATSETKGMVTGTKVNVLGTSSYLYSTTFYDDRGRVIQSHSTNYSGGKDTATMQYDFSGKLLRSLVCHAKAGTNGQRHIMLTKNDYDDVGRIIIIKKKTNNSPEVTIAENSYDELGQLRMKKLGKQRNESSQNTYTSTAIDSLKYSYNIRGWLRGINKDYARGENGANNWFGMELNYDFGFTATQRNGNIAGIRWKSNGSDETRAYGFTYDAMNRLLKADFTQKSGSSWNTSAGIDFTMKMGDGIHTDSAYDANGNILKMVQKGLKITSSSNIDSLTYFYLTSSNKLTKVTDAITANNQLGDFKDGTNSGDDYSYDDNGNMVTDQNKNITSIIYNHLNLPDSIRILGKGTIKYLYDASGIKVAKKTVDSTGSTVKITTTSYIGGFVYQNDSLQFIAQEEGRIRENRIGSRDTMYYDYFVKDHLGNVRMMLTDEMKTDVYVCTMESENDELENELFSLRNNLFERPDCFNTASEENGKVQRIGRKEEEDPNAAVVGAGIVLKVMAGDKVNAKVFGWFNEDESGIAPEATSLPDIISGIFSDGITKTATKGGGISITEAMLSPAVIEFLNGQTNSSSDDGAYLNWILLDDEQFNLVSSGSGFESLIPEFKGSSHECSDLATLLQANEGNGIDIPRNGYLYIYLSNTNTEHPVYFDDLIVEHIRGPLLDETHYYPFGLTMAGICSKAGSFGNPENKKNKFQNQEFNDDLAVDMYEFKWRMDDPQIGRFWQIDPLSEKYVYNSTYAFSENKVTGHIELEGLEAVNPKYGGVTSTTSDVLNQITPTNFEPSPFNVQKINKSSGAVQTNSTTESKPGAYNKASSRQPTVGRTASTTITASTVVFENGVGDKGTVENYITRPIGTEGKLATIDQNINFENGAPSSTGSYTVGGMSLGFDMENVAASINLSGTSQGINPEVGFSVGAGRLPDVSAGGNCKIGTETYGARFKLQIGLGTTVAGIAAIGAAVYGIPSATITLPTIKEIIQKAVPLGKPAL